MSDTHNLVLRFYRITKGGNEQAIIFPCPDVICDENLPSYHALRMHFARKHKEYPKGEIRKLLKPAKILDQAFREGRLIFEV